MTAFRGLSPLAMPGILVRTIGGFIDSGIRRILCDRLVRCGPPLTLTPRRAGHLAHPLDRVKVAAYFAGKHPDRMKGLPELAPPPPRAEVTA